MFATPFQHPQFERYCNSGCCKSFAKPTMQGWSLFFFYWNDRSWVKRSVQRLYSWYVNWLLDTHPGKSGVDPVVLAAYFSCVHLLWIVMFMTQVIICFQKSSQDYEIAKTLMLTTRSIEGCFVPSKVLATANLLANYVLMWSVLVIQYLALCAKETDLIFWKIT